jgi:hypothetical protein
MAIYPPLFKRIKTNPEIEGEAIAKMQDEFERFWHQLSKKHKPNSERTMAMRKMQEAAMWLARSIAIGGFISDSPTVREAQNGNKGDFRPTYPKSTPVDLPTGEKYTTKPTVIVKKKRTLPQQ